MKITVKNAEFGTELNLLEKLVGKKPTISVLANVLIQANMGAVVMTSTDLEIGLVGACAADVEEPGAITLPAKKLVEIVRAQSGDKLTLQSDARGAVKFTSGKFASKLQSLPAIDFPSIPNADGLTTATLPRLALRRALAQVRYAISDKDSRYFTKGALMELNAGGITFVAVDAARLALSKVKHPGLDEDKAIVPSKALDELYLLLGEPGDSDVAFSQTERHMFFDLDGRLLISRQIEAKFPAYERVIPKGEMFTTRIPRQEFSDVLKRLVLIHEVVVLNFYAGGLDVSAASAEVGEGVERIDTDYAGTAMEMRFKGEYLLDFLGASDAEFVTMQVKDPSAPAMLLDEEYFNVVMGMRL